MLTLKCRLLGLETCTSRGVKNDVFSMVGGLGGDFIRSYMSQSCLGCIVEVF